MNTYHFSSFDIADFDVDFGDREIASEFDDLCFGGVTNI